MRKAKSLFARRIVHYRSIEGELALVCTGRWSRTGWTRAKDGDGVLALAGERKPWQAISFSPYPGWRHRIWPGFAGFCRVCAVVCSRPLPTRLSFSDIRVSVWPDSHHEDAVAQCIGIDWVWSTDIMTLKAMMVRIEMMYNFLAQSSSDRDFGPDQATESQ